MLQAVSWKIYDFSIVAGEIIQITYETHQVEASRKKTLTGNENPSGTKEKKLKEEKK